MYKEKLFKDELMDVDKIRTKNVLPDRDFVCYML